MLYRPGGMAGGAFILLLALAAWGLPLVLGLDPDAIDLAAMHTAPSGAHWLGTDGVGRDVLARVLQGARVSLVIAIIAAAISASIGFLVGTGAAFGKVADVVCMRTVDLVMTLPPVVLLLVLSAIAGQGERPTIVVLALLSWPLLARLVRARLLELRERDFIVAAQATGAGAWHILRRHVLPNMADILIVYATLQIATNVLMEAGLSFLGLGVPPPTATWGNMLGEARSLDVLTLYTWQWLAPGAALLATTLAIGMLGEAVRAGFDTGQN
jgi:peptide/nickel transport system permease protein